MFVKINKRKAFLVQIHDIFCKLSGLFSVQNLYLLQNKNIYRDIYMFMLYLKLSEHEHFTSISQHDDRKISLINFFQNV